MDKLSQRQAEVEALIAHTTKHFTNTELCADVVKLCREWLDLVKFVESIECKCEHKIRCGAKSEPIVYQCDRCATLAGLGETK